MIKVFNPDTDTIPDLFKGFEQDSAFIKVDIAYADKVYKDLIRSGVGQIFILLDDNTGESIGGFGCIKSPDLHSGRMMAVETFWYVVPEYRNSLGGAQLYDSFERWAAEQGCEILAMIHMIDSSPEKLRKLYEKKGYRLAEQHYIKEV